VGAASTARRAPDTRLGGRVRTRINAAVRARHQPCPMCGYPIDQTLNRMGRCHPLSSQVDEWIPREPCNGRCQGDCIPVQPGEVNTENCVELHATCNNLKSNHWPVTDELRARCRREVEAILTPHGKTRTW